MVGASEKLNSYQPKRMVIITSRKHDGEPLKPKMRLIIVQNT